MPNLTPRLGLKKPLPTDVADISVLNENYDLLDSVIATVGTDNQSINFRKALDFPVDTRATALTYTSGRLTKVEEKDGATVVKSTTITYDGLGRVSKVTETAGGKTVTITLNYNTAGTLSSVSKAVN
jgi:YD repeat-containing protein